jgi:hypothetical protein
VGYEDSNWKSPQWQVHRQDNRPENYGFFHRQVVYTGINLVAGLVHDEAEWQTRLSDNIDWITAMYDMYRGPARVMVVLSHASLESAQNQNDFFVPFFDLIENNYQDMHFVFVHRNSPMEVTNLQTSYNGISNLDVITAMGSTWPPLQATVDLQDGVSIKIDQENWL